MESTRKILQLLSDGRYHSGEEIGELLGISRAAVWKQLKKLKEIGVSLTSVKGKGYCVDGGVELLSKERILAEMLKDVRSLCSSFDCHWSTPSTNAFLLDSGKGNYQSGRVCITEMQTAGRGRRGRAWVSPFGKNIYLSLQWGFTGGVGQVEGLSLAVGLAVAKALESKGVSGVSLKWPNDILWNDRKLAGVLLELVGDPTGLCYVVVGIGVNVSMSKAVDIDQPWVNVSEAAGRAISRNELISAILNELLPILSTYADKGFGTYKGAWNNYDGFKGRRVSILSVDSRLNGVSAGVGDTGALLLQVEGESEPRAIHGGEVSLRSNEED